MAGWPTDDVELLVLVLHEHAAVHFKLSPGTLIDGGGLRNDVRHHKRGVAHRFRSIAITMWAHVAPIETGVRIVLGNDDVEAPGQRFVGIKWQPPGRPKLALREMPAHPIRRALRIVIRKGKIRF